MSILAIVTSLIENGLPPQWGGVILGLMSVALISLNFLGLKTSLGMRGTGGVTGNRLMFASGRVPLLVNQKYAIGNQPVLRFNTDDGRRKVRYQSWVDDVYAAGSDKEKACANLEALFHIRKQGGI